MELPKTLGIEGEGRMENKIFRVPLLSAPEDSGMQTTTRRGPCPYRAHTQGHHKEEGTVLDADGKSYKSSRKEKCLMVGV